MSPPCRGGSWSCAPFPPHRKLSLPRSSNGRAAPLQSADRRSIRRRGTKMPRRFWEAPGPSNRGRGVRSSHAAPTAPVGQRMVAALRTRSMQVRVLPGAPNHRPHRQASLLNQPFRGKRPSQYTHGRQPKASTRSRTPRPTARTQPQRQYPPEPAPRTTTNGANHARTRHAPPSGRPSYATPAARRPEPALQRFVVPMLEQPENHRSFQGTTETLQPALVLRQSAALRRPAHNAGAPCRSRPHQRRNRLTEG